MLKLTAKPSLQSKVEVGAANPEADVGKEASLEEGEGEEPEEPSLNADKVAFSAPAPKLFLSCVMWISNMRYWMEE